MITAIDLGITRVELEILSTLDTPQERRAWLHRTWGECWQCRQEAKQGKQDPDTIRKGCVSRKVEGHTRMMCEYCAVSLDEFCGEG